MPRIGLIAGTVFFRQDLFSRAEQLVVETACGQSLVLVTDDLAFIPRHGLDENDYVMPHRINHAANFLTLRHLSVETVIGINSSGSLKPHLKPGMIAVPDDFISFFNIPSIFQTTPGHCTPKLDQNVRRLLLLAAQKAGISAYNGGVYWQCTGPRLETRAEVRLIAQFADLVGMTVGSEATIACELNMPYASICTIDNWAHGLVDEPLTEQQIREAAARNAQTMGQIVKCFLELGNNNS
jgi:5'-methylthioadenosine phosphorylase